MKGPDYMAQPIVVQAVLFMVALVILAYNTKDK